MLKAYSIIKDLNKKACEIIKNNGIQLDISNSDKRPDKDELIKLLNQYDILIIGIEDKFTKDMLPMTTKKKIIATLSIGLDHIDNVFLENDNIKIINCQNSNVVSVAEHIFALILGLKKRIIEANDISLKGENRKKLSMKSNDITGSTLGVIGAGKISREVIRISKVFDMNIICNTLNPELHEDLMKQGVKFVSLDEVLSNADIITINIP